VLKQVFSLFVLVSLLTSTLTLAHSIKPVGTEVVTELSKKGVSEESPIVQPAVAASQEVPPADWNQTYGGYGNDFAFSVDEADDGGYVVAGSTDSMGVGIDAWLFKTFPNGTLQWMKNYGGLGYDYATCVEQTNDHGYILTGATKSYSLDGCFDMWLVKTDSNGNMLWTKARTTNGTEVANSVEQTSDGGYIMAGSYDGDPAPIPWSSVLLVKTNGTGYEEWSLSWGGNATDVAYSAVETKDGGFIAAGSTIDYYNIDKDGNLTFASTDALLIKTDWGGNIEWNKTYGGPDSVEQFYSIQKTYDGHYIAAGYTNSSGTGSFDFWLVKIGTDGSVMWERAFGGLDDEYAYSVQQTSDDGYIVAGPTYSSSYTSPDFLIVKTDSNGNEEWRQIYDTGDTDEAQSIHETNDGGYIVAGYTYYSSGISTDAWLVKITGDTDGDGLHDSWERKGIDYNMDGAIDFLLPGADWRHKDLFVEVDYMTGHEFDPMAKEMVVNAFKNAPVKNPDGKEGINLHVDIDEQIPHQTPFKIWDDYDTIKASHFGSSDQRSSLYSQEILGAKKLVYRYCLFIHDQAKFDNASHTWETKTYSGMSEFPGNDFVVSLGTFTDGKGSVDEQAGTFMHELGHTLGLDHGGADDVNYKPNYLSIMNYAFQFPDLNPLRPLDYSRTALPDLDEAHLNEPAGIGAEVTGQMLFTVYSNATNQTVLGAGFLPIDWNGNGNATDPNVVANINNFPQWDSESPVNETLHGYDDWKNLDYNFRDVDTFPDFAHGEQPKSLLTWETVQSMREAVKSMHDVAVLKVEVAQPFIVSGSTLPMNVTLMNQGGNNETFLVTVYANATSIASQELSLERGNITTIALTGDTTGLSTGDYTLSAYATPVAGETDLADNTYDYDIITITSTSGGWVEWSQSYPKTKRAQAYSVYETTDGGFAIAGGTGTPGYNTFLLIKTYPNGTEQWSRTYSCGQYCDQYAYSVEQTTDGGYMLAGYLHQPVGPSWLWLVKTDSEGNALWNKTYASDFGNSEHQWVAQQTSDGGYIAAGTHLWNENGTERHEMWLIKTDSEGNEMWNITFNRIRDWALVYSVWQTTDGGYIIGGYESSPESSYGAALLVKTDSVGNEQWNKTYTAARIFSLQQTADDGYILGGAMYYGGNDFSDFWMLKTDQSGKTLWNRTYDCARWTQSEFEEAYSVQQTSDGGYILAGHSDRVVGQLLIRYVWIVKSDVDGNMQTDLVYGGENTRESVAYSVRQIGNDSYIIAGYITQPRDDDPYATDFLLMKFRILLVIPEFTPNFILPILAVITLIAILVSRRRRIIMREPTTSIN